jgi:S1-C subfamily serine protease
MIASSRSLGRVAILAGGSQLILACTPMVPVQVEDVPERAPVEIALGADLQPISLDRVSINIRRGTIIGEYFWDIFAKYCAGLGNITWDHGRLLTHDAELSGIFFDELTDAKYSVVGNPNRLFEGASDARRDPVYLVGARIDSIKMKVCQHRSRFDDRVTGLQSGNSSISVRWQVFDTIQRKVVYSTTTEGSGKLDTPIYGGEPVLVAEAFAAAARNLGADRGFFDLVSKSRPSVADIRAVEMERLLIPRQKQFAAVISENIGLIRLAAVTIETGHSHGSGFFISPTLVITNSHVVKGSSIIKIGLVTGRAILGEVVRQHPQRDVALVQVEDTGHRPLAIRVDPLEITEDVYAIGTPLEREAAATVTKGIVSKFRKNRFGLEDIQADVDIHGGNSGGALVDSRGNVVGISYAGVPSEDGGNRSIGINFFIPIHDALDKLNIGFGEASR